MAAELPSYEEWVALGRPDLLSMLGLIDTDPPHPHLDDKDFIESQSKALRTAGVTDDIDEANALAAELMDIATYWGRAMKAERLFKEQKC